MIGDLIPYQDDRKAGQWMTGKVERASEYSGSCIDMRANEVLVSSWVASGPWTMLMMAGQIELLCTPQLRGAKRSAMVRISKSRALRRSCQPLLLVMMAGRMVTLVSRSPCLATSRRPSRK